MKTITGLVASPGMCRGKAFVVGRYDLESAIGDDRFQGIKQETARLTRAIETAINETRMVIAQTSKSLGGDAAHIFRSQQTILEDQSIISEIENQIQSEQLPASLAIKHVFDSYLSLFSELDDEDYNKARMSDIQDVARRLTLAALDLSETGFNELDEGRIIVAEELLPSDTALLDPERIKGFVTEKGGITSHVAILAKNMGLPAAVGVTGAINMIVNGQDLFLDTASDAVAHIYIDQDAESMKEFASRLADYEIRCKELKKGLNKAPVTLDGFEIKLSANIGSVKEAEIALSNGAKSIGLFRTEFLFLGKEQLPGEEEQYQAYRQVGRMFAPEMVLIRTLDVGGDKHVPALSLASEANPFLGHRGIRVSLEKPALLESQLRAIFRANEMGNLKIMFPMISAVEEVQRVLEIRTSVVKKLEEAGEKFNAEMEIGIMVELPSTLLVLEDLAQAIDFFSIGTNDLTQYLYGADRMNEVVSSYYRVFGPAVLRAVANVVEVAHKNGKWVGICGELAGMSDIVPFLVGLGVDELSMSSGQLSETLNQIRSLEKKHLLENLVPNVLAGKTESEVLDCLSSLK